MNKKIIVAIIAAIIVVTLIIVGFVVIVSAGLVGAVVIEQGNYNNELEIKTNKETIYEMFDNFPESNNIYYSSNNLYSDRSIGPEIYQIDILAELKDEAYKKFVDQVQFEELDNFEIKVKPNNKNYNWRKMKNTNIIKSTNNEAASIKSIYLDENTKTIYVIALGGN